MWEIDAKSLDTVDFRELYKKFLIVRDIDDRTKGLIKNSGYAIRPDTNAMLVYGYIDHTAGISFEFLCSAYIYENGGITLEPGDNTSTLKFRYGSFSGIVSPFTDENRLVPYREFAEFITENYDYSDKFREFRQMKEIDSLRAPGFPDDIVVYFLKKDFRSEGIWCRIVDIDTENQIFMMEMLNEPNAPFRKHIGDIVEVGITKTENGEYKAVKIFL